MNAAIKTLCWRALWYVLLYILGDKEVLPEPLLCLGVGSLNREQEAVQVLLAPAAQPQRILRSLDGHTSGHIGPFIPANQPQRILRSLAVIQQAIWVIYPRHPASEDPSVIGRSYSRSCESFIPATQHQRILRSLDGHIAGHMSPSTPPPSLRGSCGHWTVIQQVIWAIYPLHPASEDPAVIGLSYSWSYEPFNLTTKPQRILRSLAVIGGHIAVQISHSPPPPSLRGSCGHWRSYSRSYEPFMFANQPQRILRSWTPATQPQRILRSWTVIGGHIEGQMSHTPPTPSLSGSYGHWRSYRRSCESFIPAIQP